MNTHDRTTTRIGLLLFFVMALLAFLANAQFGSFVHDQPFLSAIADVARWLFAKDDAETYAADDETADVTATGTNEVLEIEWTNLYVTHMYQTSFYTVYLDDAEPLTADVQIITNDMAAGTNYVLTQVTNDAIAKVIGTNDWTNYYVGHVYQNMFSSNAVDTLETLTEYFQPTTNPFAAGTNFTMIQITNDLMPYYSAINDWTNYYVGLIYSNCYQSNIVDTWEALADATWVTNADVVSGTNFAFSNYTNDFENVVTYSAWTNVCEGVVY